MRIYNGKSVFNGIAIGKIRVYKRDVQQVKRTKVTDMEAELSRFASAKEEAVRQLQGLYDKALKEVGEANAAIFEVHQMMLDDVDYNESVENIVRSQEVNVEYAVAATGDNFSQMFAAMDDDYMRERAADVKDISERLLTILSGKEDHTASAKEPAIIIADDLAPSETVQLDKDMVLSFVTVHGSTNSHTAILARMMEIPALVGTKLPLDDTVDGKTGIVDGGDGKVYVDPDEETLNSMRRKKEEADRRRLLLNDLKGKRNVTGSGRSVKVFANVGTMADVWAARENDAGGIGLLRSELLYLGRREAPSEEDLFVFYRQVLERMEGKEVVIRTFDIGADKQVPYVGTAREENPALGLRAIRLGLRYPELLKTQLRALYRAGRYGCLRIMYPMITSPEEVCQLKTLEEQARQELSHRGETFLEQVPTGIMIETPAAALLAGELAKEVDFFSVGTNDLTQFTLALDRGSGYLEQFADPGHRAVLRLTEMAAKPAHEAGIWIGVCGDLAADTRFTERFLEMGIDEFSVAPGEILRLRQKIRGL